MKLALQEADKALEREAIKLENIIVEILGDSITRTGVPGPQTQRSAPGEPPAPQTGAYEASFGHEKVKMLEYQVGTNDKRAVWLEFGTSKMAPRPHMRPALAIYKATK